MLFDICILFITATPKEAIVKLEEQKVADKTEDGEQKFNKVQQRAKRIAK